MCGGASSRHTLPAIGLALVEELDALFPSVRQLMLRRGDALRARFDALLSDGRTVLLVPSLLTPAPRHHENLLRFPDAAQTGLFNVMQLPATAVPLPPPARSTGGAAREPAARLPARLGLRVRPSDAGGGDRAGAGRRGEELVERLWGWWRFCLGTSPHVSSLLLYCLDSCVVNLAWASAPRHGSAPCWRVGSYCPETMYTQPAHFQCRVRARRGDDVHAERCPRVGRDQALLRSVLGSHVVDFPFF